MQTVLADYGSGRARAIEPAELVQVLDGPAAELGVVAIGVCFTLERKPGWGKLLDQLADREIELRWESGTSAWEARLYTLADPPPVRRILTPTNGGPDADSDGLLHEMPGEPADGGTEGRHDEERPAGARGDVPGVQGQDVQDRPAPGVAWGAPGYVWPFPGDVQLVDLDRRPKPDLHATIEKLRAQNPGIHPEPHRPVSTAAVTPPDPTPHTDGGVTAHASDGLPVLGIDYPTQLWVGRLSAAGKSYREIAAELGDHGISVSHMKIGRLLKRLQ